jgi:hypothetical protein
MALREFFLGTDPRIQQIPRFSPEQQQVFSQLLGMGLQQAQQPQFDFTPIAEQARTQFQQRTIPTIAERFTALGQGAQRSSAFPQILGSAGAELEGNLASLGAQYGLEQQRLNQARMFDLLRLGLTPQFEPRYVEGEPGFLQTTAFPAGQSLLSLLPTLTGGIGGAIGSGLSALMGLFNSGRTNTSARTMRAPAAISGMRQGLQLLR